MSTTPAPRILVRGDLRTIADLPADKAALTATVAVSPYADEQGRQYVVTDEAVHSQHPVFAVRATGEWTCELVWAVGTVYRISARGYMPDVMVYCDALTLVDGFVAVDARDLIEPPGGATPVEWVTLTAVIAGIDAKVASEVAEQVPPAVATELDAILANPATPARVAIDGLAAAVVAEMTWLSWRHGVVSDGVTNAAAALNALIQTVSDAGGGTIMLRNVTLASAVTLRPNVRLVGRPGATLRKSGTNTKWIQPAAGSSASGGEIRDLILDADGKVTSMMVDAGDSAGLRIIDCELRSTYDSAYTYGGDGSPFIGIDIPTAASRVVVQQCAFTGIPTPVRTRSCTGPTVTDCLMTDWSESAIYYMPDAANALVGARIERNSVEPHRANLPAASTRQPIRISMGTTRTRDIKIRDNVVTGLGTASDDPLNPGSADLISLHNCEDFEVSGNTATDGGDVGITVAQQSRRGRITNNALLRNDSVGICAGSSDSTVGMEHVTITANLAMNNSQDRSGVNPARAKAGILVNKGSDITVTGNTCGDDQTVKTQLYGVAFANVARVKARSNALDFASGGAEYYFEGTNAAVDTDARLFVEATADQSVNNSTALVDDAALVLTVMPGRKYLVTAYVLYNSSTDADMALKWSGPSGSTFTWTVDALSSATTSATSSIVRTGATIGTTATIGGAGANAVARPIGTLTTVGGGTLKLQWAQGTAEASDTIRRAGSWLRLELLT